MFENLLVAIDGSAHGTLAARLAGKVAGTTGKITLLHVAHDPAMTALAGLDAAAALVTGAASAMRVQRRLENEREGALILNTTREVLPVPEQVATVVETGRPADVLLDRLEKTDASAAVLGSRGFGPFARALLGSVSDAVLRHAKKPVLIARTDRLDRILVAVDGSEPSRRAAQAAAQLARRVGASVALVHAAPLLPSAGGLTKDEVESALRQEAELAFAPAREALRGLVVREELQFDEPAPGILEQATRLGADLVILGRAGRVPSPRVPIGAVALRVASDAQASVLVVP